MPSFSAFCDSVRCCCRTRRSCWMSSFSAFNDSNCIAVRSEVVGFSLSKKTVFKPPGTWYCYCRGLTGTAPNRSIRTRTKTCRKYIHSWLRVFSVPSSSIFSALLCQASSLSCLIFGVTWHALLSLPLYRARAFVLIAREKKVFRIKLPSLASPCVELVCVHATY